MAAYRRQVVEGRSTAPLALEAVEFVIGRAVFR